MDTAEFRFSCADAAAAAADDDDDVEGEWVCRDGLEGYGGFKIGCGDSCSGQANTLGQCRCERNTVS